MKSLAWQLAVDQEVAVAIGCVNVVLLCEENIDFYAEWHQERTYK